MTEERRMIELVDRVYNVLPEATKAAVPEKWQAVLLAGESYYKDLLAGSENWSLLSLPEPETFNIVYFMAIYFRMFLKIPFVLLMDRFGLTDEQIHSMMYDLHLHEVDSHGFRYLRNDFEVKEHSMGTLNEHELGHDIVRKCALNSTYDLKSVFYTYIYTKELPPLSYLYDDYMASTLTNDMMSFKGVPVTWDKLPKQMNMRERHRNSLRWDVVTEIQGQGLILNPRNPLLISEKTVERVKKLREEMSMSSIADALCIPLGILKSTMMSGMTYERVKEERDRYPRDASVMLEWEDPNGVWKEEEDD